jgi:acyl dehydratase
MCGFAMASALLLRLNIFEGTIVAFIGIDNWRFHAPIKIGDTIHMKARVAEKRESKNRVQGQVILDEKVFNQEGTLVMGGIVRALMKMRL